MATLSTMHETIGHPMLSPWEETEGAIQSRKRPVMPAMTSTGTVTVNAAFLREIKEENEELRALLADLHHRFQRPIDADECRPMVDRLYPLLDALAMHFSLEEAYGYFDNPLDIEPQFSQRADRLRSEHRQLYQALSGLIEWAEQMFYDERHPELALCFLQGMFGARFLKFERWLRRHEIDELDLICEAYITDLGVVD